MIRRLVAGAAATTAVLALTLALAPNALASVVPLPPPTEVTLPEQAAPVTALAGPPIAAVCTQVFGAVGTTSIAGLVLTQVPSTPVTFSDTLTLLYYGLTQACIPFFGYLEPGSKCASLEGAVAKQVAGAGSPVGVPAPPVGGMAVDTLSTAEGTASGTSGQSLPASPSGTIGGQLGCAKPTASSTSVDSRSGGVVSSLPVSTGSGSGSGGSSSVGGSSDGDTYGSARSSAGGSTSATADSPAQDSTALAGDTALGNAQPTSSTGGGDRRGMLLMVVIGAALLVWAVDSGLAAWGSFHRR